MKECFGEYDHKKEKCLDCPDRIKCMAKKWTPKYIKLEEGLEMKEKKLDILPHCFGSFLGDEHCDGCFYREKCILSTGNVERQVFRQGKHRRQTGKYKERGKWQRKDIP